MSQTDAAYSIGQVSDLLGVPAPTIRSWERRHSLRPDTQTRAGHRRYGVADIVGLRRMRDELAAGRSAAEAASIVRSLRTCPPAVLARRVWAAAHDFDGQAIGVALEQARTLHGLNATVDLVLLPAMRELGQQWSNGTCDVAHEHLATAAVQGWLGGAASAAPPSPAQDPVVLACGPDEQHTLGLDALAVLLGHLDVRCLHLGARVPAASLRRTVHDSGARAVVLTCQLASNRQSAIAALQALADTPAALHYAGAAFRTEASRRGLAGCYLGDSLGHAARQLVAPRQDPEAVTSLARSR